MGKGIFKIYVGNLDYRVTDVAVRRLFEPFGEIEDVALARDRESDKPRGFAIVMMRNHDEALAAIEGVRGRRLLGRQLIVNEAVRRRKSDTEPIGVTTGEPVKIEAPQPAKPRPKRDPVARPSRNPRRAAGGGGRNPRRGGGGRP